MSDFAGAITQTMFEGRADAESLMLDDCTITRVDATAPFTTDANGVDHPTLVTVYSGKCKVQTLQAQETTPEVGGRLFTVQRARLDVPVGGYAPQVGDVATLTSGTFDEYLFNRKLRVVALLHKSMATAYRLGVTDEAA